MTTEQRVLSGATSILVVIIEVDAIRAGDGRNLTMAGKATL